MGPTGPGRPPARHPFVAQLILSQIIERPREAALKTGAGSALFAN
jgi:hypothetical protein